MIKKIFNFLNSLSSISSEIGGWLMLLIVILTLIDVGARNLSKHIVGLDLYAVLVFMIAIYLGLAHSEMIQGHIKVEIFLEKSSLKFRRVLYLVDYILELTTLLIVIIASITSAIDSFIDKEALSTSSILIKTYPVRFIIVIGVILYFFQIFINFYNKIKFNKLN